MLRIRLIALLLVIFAFPAHASDAKPNEESIKQLITITESRKLVDSMMSQMEGMMKNAMQQAMKDTSITPEQQKAFDKMQAKINSLLKQELSWENLEPMYIEVYRNTFSQEEIDGLLAFYKTPSGQALIKKMPVLVQQTTAEMQKRMQQLFPKIEKITQESLAEFDAMRPKRP